MTSEDLLRDLVNYLARRVKRGGPSNFEQFIATDLSEAHKAAYDRAIGGEDAQDGR